MPDRKQLLLAALRRHPNLDPQAVLRVAGAEGLSGGIGDGGHAFGPFQLNEAGGVVTGKLHGTAAQKNAWAWSPQGIDFALQGIERVAAGQHGPQAVESIVRRFERPADPNGEIARALGGGASSSAAVTPTNPSFGAPAAGNRQAFTQSLLGAISPTGQLDNPSALIQALQARQPLTAAWGNPSGPTIGGKAGQGQKGLPPLSPGKLANIGGVQVDPAIAGGVEDVLKRFGVRPSSGYRSPQHNTDVGGAPGSDHLSGDAVDFGGNPQALSALYKWAQGRFPYVEPMAQAKDHVHISFRRP